MAERGLRTDEECERLVKSHKERVLAEQRTRNTRIEEIWRRRKNAWGATDGAGGRDPDIPGVFAKTTKRFRAPFIGDMIRRSQAIIATKLPTARKIPIPGVLSQEEADAIEEWFNLGFWPRSLIKKDWFAQGTDALANDAECVWKVIDRGDTWLVQRDADESTDSYNLRTKQHKHENLPIVIEHVATNTYYPVDDDDEGVCEVWEITRRKSRAIADKYDLVQTPQGLRRITSRGRTVDPTTIGEVIASTPTASGSGQSTGAIESCEFIEVWTSPKKIKKGVIPGQFFYLVDGQVVKSGKHKYKRQPYFHTAFSTTSSHEPGYETESIADPMVSLQDKIENLITALENVIWTGGFPTLRLRLVNEELIPPYDKEGKVNIVINPGGVLEGVPLGYIAEWMPAPDVGANAGPYREMLMSMMDRMSLAPILYAHLETQMSTPVATTLIAIARAIFGPGLANLARTFDQMAEHIQYIIVHVLKEPVPIYAELADETGSKRIKWLELGPDDIKGYYGIVHSLEPIIPMEQAQTTIMNENLYNNGLLSPEAVLEGAGISSPTKMLEQRLIWDGIKGATFQQLFAEQFSRRIMQDERYIPPGSPPTLPAGPGGPVPQIAANVPPGAEIPVPLPVNPAAASAGVPGG